jgi:hypothetical protein
MADVLKLSCRDVVGQDSEHGACHLLAVHARIMAEMGLDGSQKRLEMALLTGMAGNPTLIVGTPQQERQLGPKLGGLFYSEAVSQCL